MLFQSVEIKDVKRNIGGVLKQFRKEFKLSQAELAKSLDVSRTTIQNVELGKNFTIDTLLKVVKSFELLDDLNNEVNKIGKQSQVPTSLY